jgi:hypothetical protein
MHGVKLVEDEKNGGLQHNVFLLQAAKSMTGGCRLWMEGCNALASWLVVGVTFSMGTLDIRR